MIGNGICADENQNQLPNYSRNEDSEQYCEVVCDRTATCVGYGYYTPLKRCAIFLSDNKELE